MDRKPMVVLAVTVSQSTGFFKGKISTLIENGFDVAVIASPGIAYTEGASFYPISMKREISLFHDMISLLQLIRLIRRLNPEIINYGTPKAGLLVGMAAFICRVPNRIYTSHGLRLETTKGIKRFILSLTEKISIFCSHKVICVSNSLKQKLIDLKLLPQSKGIVIRNGSCKGLDVEPFEISDVLQTQVSCLKKKIGIESDEVIGYVGRFTRDKGIYELINAFNKLKIERPNICLLLCGTFEEGDPIDEDTKWTIENDPNIYNVGFVEDTLPYYFLMNVLILPSYREGFGNVILEANAACIPVIATYVTGCVDAVKDGETGFLVPPRDSNILAEKVSILLNDPNRAREMGKLGKKRVLQDFKPKDIFFEYVRIYKEMV
ncbi:hypothetical protein A3844_07785 [Paenibacillus helianthi]|uniref:Glycosyltransferase family 1 protein n=1 Tax=Paenibacillus helianthi TaxID=1349432 RepID=A0ABX3ESD5_9BACL|nr:glycosyltransferase family 4 protein [Paenibacillus helianthi]OKP88584.1 hypothetical protein A3844_07785 [Paenibacillus helianthi]